MGIAIRFDMRTVEKYDISDDKKEYVRELIRKAVGEIEQVLDIHNDRFINVRFNRGMSVWGSMKGSFGRLPINYNGPLSGTLTLNHILLKIDEYWLKDVIMHELLHMNPACHNHTGLWKQYAQRINEALGYKISRCSSAEEMGINNVQDYRYVLECVACHSKQKYLKKSNAIKYPFQYRCLCGGKFKSYSVDGKPV